MYSLLFTFVFGGLGSVGLLAMQTRVDPPQSTGNINVCEVRRFAAVVAKTNGIETGHVSCNDSGFNLVPVYAKFGISPTGQCSHLLT